MSVSTLVDPADVATVEALEPQVKALIAAARAALPAILRLDEAGYPGAGMLPYNLNVGEAAAPSDGDLVVIAEVLENLRVGAGDEAAYNYHRLVVQGGMTLRAACDELMEHCSDPNHDLDRVEALRHYAASHASGK